MEGSRFGMSLATPLRSFEKGKEQAKWVVNKRSGNSPALCYYPRRTQRVIKHRFERQDPRPHDGYFAGAFAKID